MAPLLHAPASGFRWGLTEMARHDDPGALGIGLAVCRLKAGGAIDETAVSETVWLLMEGSATVAAGGRTAKWRRRSPFTAMPAAVHLPAGERMVIRCDAPSEFVVLSTSNRAPFAPQILGPKQVDSEWRSRGRLDETALRAVRTIIHDGNTDHAATLVVGEVLHLPGRWSSYPPHHHPQPEIYHYRFDRPQGYGHAEMGESVFKVRHGDTLRITPDQDHAQVAAPGYAMLYVWAIRHLADSRYVSPTFADEHAWTLRPRARTFWPRGLGRRG